MNSTWSGYRRWLFAWCAVTIGLASFPYALGYFLHPQGQAFMGLLPYFNDGASYVAKMMEGLNGHWLFYLPYTSEPHDPAPLFLVYLLLGKISAVTGLPPIVVFHGVRVAGGFILLLFCYRFLAQTLHNLATTRLAFLLACLFGGGGWLTFVIPTTWLIGTVRPVDLTRADANVFWSLLTFPHHILGIGLLLLVLPLSRLAFLSGRLRVAVLAGLITVASSFVHPSYPAIILAIVATYVVLRLWYCELPAVNQAADQSPYALAYSAISSPTNNPFLVWKRLGRLASRVGVACRNVTLSRWASLGVVVAMALLSLAYQRQVIAGNWALSLWQEDSSGSTWPIGFGQYAFAYGPLGALALAGLPSFVRRHGEKALLTISWAVAVPLLIIVSYAADMLPLAHGLSRASIGWTIPLSILAAVGLRRCLVPFLARFSVRSKDGRATARRRRWRSAHLWATCLVFMVGFPSIALVLTNAVVIDLRHERPYFLSVDEVASLTWLREQTSPDDIVLSGAQLGSLIPAVAGNRVYLGHAVETLHEASKAAAAAAFYRNEMALGEQERFLSQDGIKYVLVGQEERSVGAQDLAGRGFLAPVFANDTVSIYRVELVNH